MRAGPVIKAASGGLSRRRAQTMVIFVVLLVSTAAATLGLGLLVTADQPFQHAFAAQRGAHLTAVIDSSRATGARLAATGRLPGVTRSAGPYPSATITYIPPDIGPGGGPGGPGSGPPPQISATVVGRASPGGPLDDLALRSGRWVRGPGEIVLAAGDQLPGIVGSKITVTSGPGKRQLTVVGMAASITGSADAWVDPSEIAAVRAPHAPASAQMFYRFADAGSVAKVRAGAAAVTAALPDGAVVGTTYWLSAEQQSKSSSSIIAPFVVAFAIMGLAMSALIVTNVVSGAVVAGYRRIGVLKSIGFSPAQVVGAYVGWVAVPALAGCLVGVALGNLLALPVLHDASDAFNVGSQSIPPWIDVVAPLVMCAMAGLAALLPALRAGRLSAVTAIATGQAPRQGRGYAAHRLLGRLRLPRPVTIGLAAPFARPARTVVTLAAIAFGSAAVVFAAGLDTSLVRLAAAQARTDIGQVSVGLPGAHPGSDVDRKVVAAIRAQPGTRNYVAEAMPSVTVPGLSGQVNATAFRGDSAWTGLSVLSGHWYHGEGEVDVNTAFLSLTGRSVGDTVAIGTGGRSRTARIVGEIFQPSREPALYGDWQTFGGTAAGLTVDQYGIDLRPGVRTFSYQAGLSRVLGNDLPVFSMQRGKKFEVTTVSLISLLTLMMAVVAGLGVLNTVLLSTRERVHDLGVFKAVGMTPRQTIAMVLCWIVGPALAATVIAAPVAVILHTAVLHAMAHGADTGLPAHAVNAYGPVGLVVVALSGVVIAAAGALAPASWAARSKTATALRAE